MTSPATTVGGRAAAGCRWVAQTVRGGLVALILAGGTASAAPTTEEQLTELRQQLLALDQKVRVLERQLEVERAEKAVAAKKAVVVKADTAGFSLESADQHFQLRLRGNVHLDGRFYLNDGGIGNNDKFLLRRVRPNLEVKFLDIYSFRVMPDLAPASVELLDAYGTVRIAPELNLLVGRTKAPVGLERLISQTNLPLIERGYPTSLLPNRDTGLQLFGKLLGGRLDYTVAVLNGAADGASSASAQLDDGFDVAGRLFLQPWVRGESWARGLGFGVAGSYGNQEGTAPSDYRTTGQQTFLSWTNTSANPVRVDGTVARLSPQGYFYHGPFGLLAEYAFSEQDVVKTGTAPAPNRRDTLHHTAWQVVASYLLTGEDAAYAGVKPLRPFVWDGDGWGAWEIVARLGELDVDNDAFPIFADPKTSATEVRGYTLGLNWYWNRHVKLTLNYDHNSFTGGASGAVTRQSEKVVLTRAQFSF